LDYHKFLERPRFWRRNQKTDESSGPLADAESDKMDDRNGRSRGTGGERVVLEEDMGRHDLGEAGNRGRLGTPHVPATPDSLNPQRRSARGRPPQ